MTVGLVVVSHVAALADGLGELAGQMATDVSVLTAGGTDDGRVGTSFDKVVTALAEAETGAGVVVLYDLGSAQMTAEMAIELLEPDAARRVRLVEAPLVEGAVAAATTAQGGADVDAVAAAARAAGGSAFAEAEPTGPDVGNPEADHRDVGNPDVGNSDVDNPEDQAAGSRVIAPQARGLDAPTGSEDEVVRRVMLTNRAGLHARPVSELARLVQTYDAKVWLGRPGSAGAEATAVLAVVAQGIRGGDELEIRARGAEARAAAEAVADRAEDGFGERDDSEQTLNQPPAPTAAPATSVSAPAASPAASVPQQTTATDETVEGADEPDVLRGDPAVVGIGIGPVRHLQHDEPDLPAPSTVVEESDRDGQRQRLQTAYSTVEAALATRVSAGGADGEIAAAHQALLADPSLRPKAEEHIAAGTPAERAWWDAVTSARAVVAAGPPEVAERAADIEDLGRQVLAALGTGGARLESAQLAGGVVVATELLPSQVRELASAEVEAVALAGGGRTAHASIIAAGLGLPMLVRVGPRLLDVAEDTQVVVDSGAGTVQVDPPDAELSAAAQRRSAYAEERERLQQAAAAPVVYADGRRVLVEANVGSLEEAHAAVVSGADGVGLLRTELLYVDRPDLPAEQEQVAELSALLTALQERPVVVRTLDVGGDKLLPAFELDPWRHGPLGVRGLRYFRDRPDLLRTQIRAVLRAAAAPGVGPVALMAPMVTLASEAELFRRWVAEAAAELDDAGRAYAEPAQIGVMVEVPAAAWAAAELCAQVDFVSVGSNDLQQYLLAADRTNEEVSWLDRPDHPALWRAIEEVAAAGRRHGVRVAVCGALAADPAHAVRLVELGVDELSVPPAAVPHVKAALRSS